MLAPSRCSPALESLESGQTLFRVLWSASNPQNEHYTMLLGPVQFSPFLLLRPTHAKNSESIRGRNTWETWKRWISFRIRRIFLGERNLRDGNDVSCEYVTSFCENLESIFQSLTVSPYSISFLVRDKRVIIINTESRSNNWIKRVSIKYNLFNDDKIFLSFPFWI